MSCGARMKPAVLYIVSRNDLSVIVGGGTYEALIDTLFAIWPEKMRPELRGGPRTWQRITPGEELGDFSALAIGLAMTRARAPGGPASRP